VTSFLAHGDIPFSHICDFFFASKRTFIIFYKSFQEFAVGGFSGFLVCHLAEIGSIKN
jgi:hypothetical protein